MWAFGTLALEVLTKIISPKYSKDAPWYTNFFHGMLFLTTFFCLLISLPSFLLGFLPAVQFAQYGLAGDITDLADLVFVALLLILPFFNLSILIWGRQPISSLRTIAAVIGMLVSANIPIWLRFFIWLGLDRDLEFFAPLFALCFSAFLMSAALYAWPGKLSRTPNIQEPEFLAAIDHPEKRNRQLSDRSEFRDL